MVKCSKCGSEINEMPCCYCQALAEAAYYSGLYRCITPSCNEKTKFKIIDGDGDYIVLQCEHCNQDFRVDIPNDNLYDSEPEPTDEEQYEAYYLARYGEY